MYYYVYNFHSDTQICQIVFPFSPNITTILRIEQKIEQQIFIWGDAKIVRHFKGGFVKSLRLMTKGEGVKNLEKVMTSFMNGPIT